MPARRAPVVLLQVANLLGGVANSTVAVLVPVAGPAGDRVRRPTPGWSRPRRRSRASSSRRSSARWSTGFGRRRVSMASDAFSAVSVSLFPLAERAGVLTLGMILALAVLGATFDPAGYTARKSLIPDVAHAGRFYIDRINGVHEGVFAAGWVIGPALAALGISTIGVDLLVLGDCGRVRAGDRGGRRDPRHRGDRRVPPRGGRRRTSRSGRRSCAGPGSSGTTGRCAC